MTQYQIHWPEHKVQSVDCMTKAFDLIKARFPWAGNLDTFKSVMKEKGYFVVVYGFSETWVFHSPQVGS